MQDKSSSNRKNGLTGKTIKTHSGSFNLDTPRDRDSSFEPQLIKKHQTYLSDDIERKILSMFTLGMNYRDMRWHIEELYGIEVSEAVISGVTDQLIPQLKV